MKDVYVCAREIRADVQSKERIPVIAMIAQVVRGDRGRCLAAGMDDYLARPIRLESPMAVLEALAG